MKRNEAFADVINLILAAWLFLSPWIVGFSGVMPAAWVAWLTGIAIGVFAIAALSAFAEWEEWINLILGLWLGNFALGRRYRQSTSAESRAGVDRCGGGDHRGHRTVAAAPDAAAGHRLRRQIREYGWAGPCPACSFWAMALGQE